MTRKVTNREEAKEVLQEQIDKYGQEYDDEGIDALEAAIKALEQEPCEDAISRNAVLMEIDKYLCGVPFDEKGIDIVIKELPPVNPQPKIGHWIIVDDCEKFIAKCSVCGRIEDSRMVHKYPYCHCGAKMKDGE